MSFLNDLGSLAASAYDFVKGSSLGSNLAKTALLGLALNQMTKSANKSNDAATAQPTTNETREQLVPNTENKVPVIYGTAYVRGIITDAVLGSDQKTMYYCVTLCEKTGPLMSTSVQSQFSIEGIWRNNCKLNFQADGFTVNTAIDDNGNVDNKISGLVKVYPFAGNSDAGSSIAISGYNPAGLDAYTIMPNWTNFHRMNDLVFLIIAVEYSKINDVVGLGDIVVKVKNSMTLPGDCLYDYMTNTRYGAGIAEEEIYSA